MSITIMNLRNNKPSHPFDYYIDRRSPVGNPFPMGNETQRDRVCDQYAEYFARQVRDITNTAFKAQLLHMQKAYKAYGELRLFCWCAPKRCHGETIRKWILANS